MAKKKLLVISEQLTVSSQDLPDTYEAGIWSGQDHYRCKLCTFDTLHGYPAMLDHLVKAHNSERALEVLVELESPVVPAEILESEVKDAKSEPG